MASDIAILGIKVDSTDVVKADKTLDDLAKASGKAEKATDKLGKESQQTGKHLKDQTGHTNKLAAGTKKLAGRSVGLGGIFAGLGIGLLAKQFSDTVTEQEKMTASLKTMTGSTENAGLAFDALSQFAATTPFTLDQSVNAFIKMKALGLDPTEAALTSFGNTAAAMGKDLNQMIEAVADASTGEFERLKEFGIKSKTEGDKVSFTFQGVTTQVGKNSDEITGYLQKIGKEKFGTAMADQMEALPGLWSNLEDTVDGFWRELGGAGATGVLKKGITSITNFVRSATQGIGPLFTFIDVMAIEMFSGLDTTIRKGKYAWDAFILGIEILFGNMFSSVGAYAANWIRGLASTLSNLPFMDGVTQKVTDFADGLGGATRDLDTEIGALNETMTADVALLEDVAQGMITDRVQTQLNKEAKDKVKKSIDDLRDSTEEGKDETVKLTAATVGVITELDKQITALFQTNEEQAIYNALAKAGVSADSEAGAAIIAKTKLIGEQKLALEKSTQAEKDLATGAAEGAAAQQKAYETAHGTLSSLFADSFTEWEGGISGFVDNALDLLKNFLAQAAAEFAASKVLGWLGFGGGTAGDSSGILGGLFGGGGGGGGGGLDISGSVLGAGKDIIGGFMDGGVSGGLEVITGKFAGAVDTFTGLPAKISDAFTGGETAAQNAIDSAQGGAAGVDWVNAGATLVAGWAGGELADAAVDAFGGKEAQSEWGKTIGGILGASTGNPLLAAAGAFVGGLVDSLFGSGKGDPFSLFKSDTNLDGKSRTVDDNDAAGVLSSAFGDFQFRTSRDMLKGQGQANEIFGILDTLVGFEDELAQNLDPAQIAGVADALGDFQEKTRGGVDIVGFFAERFSTIIGAVGGDLENEFIRLTDGVTELDQVVNIAAGLFANFSQLAAAATDEVDPFSGLGGDDGPQQASMVAASAAIAGGDTSSDARTLAEINVQLTRTSSVSEDFMNTIRPILQRWDADQLPTFREIPTVRTV